MARGYPDFYGYEIIPKYGLPNLEVWGTDDIANGDTATLINAVGKGRSYQGYIWFYGLGTVHHTAMLSIIIDGVTITYASAENEYEYGFYLDGNQLFNVTRYMVDDTNEYVTYSAARDYTWGQSLVVTLRNTTGFLLTTRASFLWGQVI